MPLEMGFGELLLILIVVVTLFGATRLPQIEELLRRLSGVDPTRPRLLLARSARRWTAVDWLLVGTTAALAVALVVSYATRL
jgi:hypothetical protein